LFTTAGLTINIFFFYKCVAMTAACPEVHVNSSAFIDAEEYAIVPMPSVYVHSPHHLASFIQPLDFRGWSKQSLERLLKPISRISKMGGRLPKMRAFSGKVEEIACASP